MIERAKKWPRCSRSPSLRARRRREGPPRPSCAVPIDKKRTDIPSRAESWRIPGRHEEGRATGSCDLARIARGQICAGKQDICSLEAEDLEDDEAGENEATQEIGIIGR